ncbi:MAG: isoaspartyl peptidase/L-asparaginase family protein [bacterium]
MTILVHGGAGSRRPSRKSSGKLREALSSGYEILKSGGTALDAVVQAISILEDSGLFNAGAGGNLQLDGVRRLDASLMEGKDLQAGSVIGLEGIRNPIQAAHLVLRLPPVIVTNVGARRIALAENLALLPEPSLDDIRKRDRAMKRGSRTTRVYHRYFSTVGAVALDASGNLASGSSTGGIAAMLPGRVGDTPIIGAGIYADNSVGAVSCTGAGEDILRRALAKEICLSLERLSPLKAGRRALRRIAALGGEAGVIVLNRKGRAAFLHTTPFMLSGYATARRLVVRDAFGRMSSV